MSIVVRTDVVPAADRLDYARDAISAAFVPMEFRSEYRADFWAEIRASGLGPMHIGVSDAMPVTGLRTPALISQNDPNLLKVMLVCDHSATVIEQAGRQVRLSRAEFAIFDTRRPYQVDCGVDQQRPSRRLSFMFPPSLLPLSPSQLRRLTATRFRATAGLGDLTARFLLQLARNIDHLSPAEATRLSGAAVEVLATRLASELDVGDWGTPEARRHALLTTVQAFVHQHLGDARLSPSGIAAAHHMSLRSLHQLFHEHGLTVAGWIRTRRLEQCRRDLADPALAGRPVAAVAARWGFSSAADFNRAFRAAHGVPPAEYRRSARVVYGSAR